MSAVKQTEIPDWLSAGVSQLNEAGRESLTLWLLRALARDVRLSGQRPIVGRPETVEEALWGMTEQPPPSPIDLTLASIVGSDLAGATWRWINTNLDGPNGVSWRTDVAIGLLERARLAKSRMRVGVGAVVWDIQEQLHGVVVDYLPAQPKGWRIYEIFTVKLDNGGVVQRTAEQLRPARP